MFLDDLRVFKSVVGKSLSIGGVVYESFGFGFGRFLFESLLAMQIEVAWDAQRDRQEL